MSKEYRLNMSDSAESLFLKAFDDEGWSWYGLAQLLRKRFKRNDEYKELIYFLKDEE